jgi:V/A-type H+/Na+-transporting ATPase subunit E
MSKLEEILRGEADAEIEELMAEADAKADKILSEAKRRAESRVAAQRKKIEAAERAAIQKARSVADHSLAIARLQAKGEMMEQVRQQVQSALEETASQSGYGEILQALAAEALKLTIKAEAVVVHPGQEENLRDWAEQQGLELRTDRGLRLGVRIVEPGGEAVENTLPERLRRAWPRLGPEVIIILWERGREGD